MVKYINHYIYRSIYKCIYEWHFINACNMAPSDGHFIWHFT